MTNPSGNKVELITMANGIAISRVALGCMPFAGTTSLHCTDQSSLACVAASLDCGINLFDTAFSYGLNGESERLLRRALAGRRKDAVIATKVGIRLDPNGVQTTDGSPDNIRQQCDECLKRLDLDSVDILYLHAPDPKIGIAESAGTLRQLMSQGKTRSIGLSNASLEQIKTFAAECPLTIYQGAYNILQCGLDHDILPWCRGNGVAVAAYWVLMRGLLTGDLVREHQFHHLDKRARWPICQGAQWQRLQDFLDVLREIAAESNRTVAQIVARWTLDCAGISVILCGASNPNQVLDNAGSMGWSLDESHKRLIKNAVAEYTAAAA